MDKIIIGFGQKRLRGKDTSALIVKNFMEEFGLSVKKLAFGDKIKDVCRAAFGFSEDQLYNEIDKETVDPFWDITPRTAFQKIGKECFRNIIRPDFWSKIVERQILCTEDHIVISDVRHLDEVEMIRKHGGILIKLLRDIPIDPSIDMHDSEIQLDRFDDWDYVIDNNHSIQELAKKLSVITKNIFKCYRII